MSTVTGLAYDFDAALTALNTTAGETNETLYRFRAEVEFAVYLTQAYPAQQAAWGALIIDAVRMVHAAIAAGEAPERAVHDAEAMLAPLGKVAKQYTIHCVGHAHIDMNWMWNWPETVATTNDTFTTVDRLMDEFPDFHFSQSQASVYQILKDYLPELYARVKQRVKEGRWEITASQWVEGDKNMASGEIICRHLLYTRRFITAEFGLPYDAVRLDWEPDTFGHPHTLPTLLAQGGVRYYYFHRGSHGPQLFWWQGMDGARVLAFDDCTRGYNGGIQPHITNGLFEFEKATGLQDYLFVYGVGDHGGGPTRRDLIMAGKMDAWPIFPNIKLSTADAFFSIAAQAPDLPVIDHELNYILEGCYTAESNIKHANRKSENALVEAEMIALVGKGLYNFPYPADALALGWRHAMFNQFHDILPGSGVHATYEHAQGLFQEIMAQTTMVKTRALRALAGRVNTAALCRTGVAPVRIGPGIGAGQGDIARDGEVSRRGAGGGVADPFVIFNPMPWTRSEVITTRLWDRDYAVHQIAVTDDAGNTFPAQVTERGNFWGHDYIGIAFPAREVPALGYRSYGVERSVMPGSAHGCSGNAMGVIENEFIRLQVEQGSGAIVHLVDKRSGVDLVPPGERLGVLEYLLEAPHPMTAWIFGQVVQETPFTSGAIIDCCVNGPHVASVTARHKLNASTFSLTMALTAGSPRVDFTLHVDWLERGAPDIGVPTLKIAFPLAMRDGVATFECANGYHLRSTKREDIVTHTTKLFNSYFPGDQAIDHNPAEVPAQKWVDLTGAQGDARVGATLVNDDKYGFSVIDQTIRLNLLRSSYDPDPLPELGQHTIRFALHPHVGDWSVADATRAGYAFNFPFNVVNTDVHEGDLPGNQGFAELLTPNVMLSGMKKAEDSDALILRLYETEGRATTAQVRLSEALVASSAPVVETDVLEQPRTTSTARLSDGVLSVSLSAFGMATVKIG